MNANKLRKTKRSAVIISKLKRISFVKWHEMSVEQNMKKANIKIIDLMYGRRVEVGFLEEGC